jgi:hypothetical protein
MSSLMGALTHDCPLSPACPTLNRIILPLCQVHTSPVLGVNIATPPLIQPINQ